MSEFKYEIKNVTKLEEDKLSGWLKAILDISWNGKPNTIDIRNIHIDEEGKIDMLGKGITLKPEECDILVNKLVNRGFGNITEFQDQAKEKLYEIKKFDF